MSCAGLTGQQAVETDHFEPEPDLVDTGCSYFYFLWGSSAEREKLYAEAQEAYEKALVCDPNAPYLKKRLAVLLARMGKPNQAIMWMQSVVAQQPDDLDARFWMARIYSLMERIPEAMKLYAGILEDDPENIDALYYLGALYLGNRQYQESREALEKLVNLYPESFGAHKLLARLFREMQYFSRAVSEYNIALELNWNIPLALEAASVLQQVDPESAISLYGQVLEEDESNEKARQYLTNLYLQQRQVDNAVKLLEELRHYTSDVLKIDLNIGRIFLENDRRDEAIDHFQSIIEENPDYHVARYFLGRAYYMNDNLEFARNALLEIPSEFKAYDDVIILLLRVYESDEDYTSMENLLVERLADPLTKQVRMYGLLASVYHKQKKNDLAEETFKQGIIDFPQSTYIIFEYGVFLEKVGDHAGAMLKMGEVIELDPEHALALNFIGYSWADNGVNLQKALEYIEKAIALRPEDGFIRDSLGWVFFRLGELDKAIVELKRAIEMAPEDPTIHEHLGDAYNKKGNSLEALKYFKKAESLYTDEEKRAVVGGKIKEILP